MNLVDHHASDRDYNKNIHAGRAILDQNPEEWEEESRQIMLLKLIPNQCMIEFMRKATYTLSLFPESERNSSKYDSRLSEQFSVSFAHAVEAFFRDQEEKEENQSVLIDISWKVSLSFLTTVIYWVNIQPARGDEFHDLLASCIQEQVLDTSMIIKNIGIRKQNGDIVLFSRESDEYISDSMNIERRKNGVSRILG